VSPALSASVSSASLCAPALPAALPLQPRSPFSANVPLCRQVIEDFGLLSFQPLAVEDRDSMRHLTALIDKSNGFVFAGLAREGEAPERPTILWLRSIILKLVATLPRPELAAVLAALQRWRPPPPPPPRTPIHTPAPVQARRPLSCSTARD
jgi:hypothetical protein